MRCLSGLMIVTLSFSLAGCGRDKEVASTAIADADDIADTIAAPPWLRDRLPADTIGYVRVPSPWGLLAAPNGKAADAMFASQGHVDAIAALRAGFAANPILSGVIGADAPDAAIRALNAIAGPVELAIIAPGKVATPAAQALVSLPLSTRAPAEAARHVSALSGITDIAFDANGLATLALHGAAAVAHFDAASGRLHLLAGATVQADQLQQRLADFAADGTTDHAARALEREIDANGQGLVAWIDAQSVKPWLMASLTADRLWLRHVFEQTQAVAFGWGGVDGHGRMSLRLQLKDPAWLRYLPQATRRLDLHSAGDPGFVFSMALPVAEDVERILTAVDADYGQTANDAWSTVDATVRENTGLGMRDWLKPFGPELLVFNDDAGVFSAIRLRDRGAWTAVLDAITRHGGTMTSRTTAAGDIHHLAWRLPTPPASPLAGEAPILALIAWTQQLPNHVFWIDEGDWLVIASVPQPLIDRLALGGDEPIGSWLAKTQGGDRQRSLLSLSGQAKDISRWFYHGYLGLLASLGDIAGTPTDLFALPTARQLGLPRQTGIGLQVISDGDRLAIDLNYEHVAIDGLIGAGGAYVGVAAIGMMAAVAIPAYENYGVRAGVATALAATAPLKTAIAEHYATMGTLPAGADVAELLDRAPPGVPAHILFEQGAILVRFRDNADTAIAGRFVYLVPYASNDGQLHFVCGNAIPPAATMALVTPDFATTDLAFGQLPSMCRP